MNTLRFSRSLPALLLTLALLLPAAPTPSAHADDAADLDLARRLENTFVRIAEQASQSVVVISATRKAVAGRAPGEFDGRDFEGTPFERFFQQHGLPMPQPRDVDSEGSGVIIRPDGYILTNNHVVNAADKIKVRLKDGREFDAQVIGVDDKTDIAVIKVDAPSLPAAKLGDSDAVKPGQWAIAIGAPFQLDYSFTVGFISATGRTAVWTRGGSAYEDYIQTDASINPGNSGGPLCDIEGRVIGINTLIRGLNRGIGFAIPINLATGIADQLITRGEVVRPWIGIQIEALADNRELAARIKDLTDGVVVRAIYSNTPAAASDLKPADIIIAVDGVPVKNPRELQKQILRKDIGQKVALNVYRDGKPLQVALTTGKLPDSPQLASNQRERPADTETVWGLKAQALTPPLAKQFGLENAQGVVVTDVQAGSIAEQQGLQPGDVITEVNRAKVASVEEFRAALSNADPATGALIYYTRDGSSAFVVLKSEN